MALTWFDFLNNFLTKFTGMDRAYLKTYKVIVEV